MKVARTRAQIASVAVELFIAQGYDETTMEQIAEAAEIGSSTLYRYFPSKELLILEPFSEVFDYGRFLRARPADEPVAEALAGALLDQAAAFADPSHRIVEMRRIIDNSPVPRARLWDLLLQSRTDFEQALAERMGLPADDAAVVGSAGLAMDLIYVVDERWKKDRSQSYAVLLREAIDDLQRASLVRPRLP